LLEVPLQPAVGERERENRVGEEIRTDALRAVAERIADGDVEEAELGIDRRRFPDAAAVALAADPCRPRDRPALIVLVLRDRVEVPQRFPALRVDGKDVAARDVALAARAADVYHAVVDLRRGREPVAERDRRRHLRKPLPDDIENDARLSVPAERRDRL